MVGERSKTMAAEGKVASGGSSIIEIEEDGRALNALDGYVDGEAGCSSWVVEMEKELIEDTDPSMEMMRWKKTSIYRVPEWIKNLTNENAYRPWLVSLGPFHHGEPDLLPMEEHKRRAVLHLVKRSGRPLREFVTAIEEVADKLQEAYQDLDDKWRRENRGRFVEMMVTDGCFLLEVMRVVDPYMDDEANDDYAPNDPVFSRHAVTNLFFAIGADMVVMENQLPLLALERLLVVQDGRTPTALEINNKVHQFLLDAPCFPGMEALVLGLHPLDILHSGFCGGRPQHVECDDAEVIISPATELSEAGVHFKKSNTQWVHDVGFENGVLSIPAQVVDEGTEKQLLNLRVFEQLHSSAGSHVTDYLCFMDDLIDSERDARLLRSKGIVTNLVCSDKALADLFNNLTKGGAASRQTKVLRDMLLKVEAHCRKRRNRWRAFFVRTYLRNPWVFISLVAAIILLVATVMQTVYTVVPFYT